MSVKVIEVPAETDTRNPRYGHMLRLTGKNHWVVGGETFISLTDEDVRAMKSWALTLAAKEFS